MGRFRRALHLCASLVVCLTLALLASRWQATRALDAARGRTEALGLRFDTDTRELPRAPVVEAAIADAWRVCRAIDDATGQRYDAEHGSSVYDEAAYDALLREEAGRASEELMVAVERYLAVGAAPRRLALPYGGARRRGSPRAVPRTAPLSRGFRRRRGGVRRRGLAPARGGGRGLHDPPRHGLAQLQPARWGTA
jgi:hypothetical protein